MRSAASAALIETNDKPRKAFTILAIVVGVLITLFILFLRAAFQGMYIPSEAMEPTLRQKDRVYVNKLAYRFKAPQRGDVIIFTAPPQATRGKGDVLFVKRLIAGPGDTVKIIAPHLTIHGNEVDPRDDYAGVHDYLRYLLDRPQKSVVKVESDGVLVDGKEKITLQKLAKQLGKTPKDITLTPGKVVINGKSIEEPYTKEDPDYDFPSDGQAAKVGADELFVLGDNRNHSADSHYWGMLKKARVVGKVMQIYAPADRVGPVR